MQGHIPPLFDTTNQILPPSYLQVGERQFTLRIAIKWETVVDAFGNKGWTLDSLEGDILILKEAKVGRRVSHLGVESNSLDYRRITIARPPNLDPRQKIKITGATQEGDILIFKLERVPSGQSPTINEPIPEPFEAPFEPEPTTSPSQPWIQPVQPVRDSSEDRELLEKAVKTINGLKVIHGRDIELEITENGKLRVKIISSIGG